MGLKKTPKREGLNASDENDVLSFISSLSRVVGDYHLQLDEHCVVTKNHSNNNNRVIIYERSSLIFHIWTRRR